MPETSHFSTHHLCREAGGTEDGWHLLPLLQGGTGERWAELGTGCGEIAILAALRNPEVRIDALEVQEKLAQMAHANVRDHGLVNRIRVLTGDVRHPPSDLSMGAYDQVFCNPPFFMPGAGRLPANKMRAIARFELLGTLDDFVTCGARLLRRQGWFHVVHRPERQAELFSVLSARGLDPCRWRVIHGQPKASDRLVLVSAHKG